MRILALDHGTKRIGVAVSDETKTIRAVPLEYILSEPFAPFLERLKKILVEKEIDLILIGHPRNMDGQRTALRRTRWRRFVGVLKTAITIPIKLWGRASDECRRRTKLLIQGGVRRDKTQGEGGQNGCGDLAAKLSGRQFDLNHRLSTG